MTSEKDYLWGIFTILTIMLLSFIYMFLLEFILLQNQELKIIIAFSGGLAIGSIIGILFKLSILKEKIK